MTAPVRRPGLARLPACADPDCLPCRIEAAILLLRSGRAREALAALAPVPDLVRGALAAARLEGAASGRAEASAALVAEARAELALVRAQVAAVRATATGEARRVEADAEEDAPGWEPGPSRPLAHVGLAAAMAEGRVTAVRVAEILKVRVADVPAIASGRVGLGSGAWCKVMAEVGG